jgi:hypothetical protein
MALKPKAAQRHETNGTAVYGSAEQGSEKQSGERPCGALRWVFPSSAKDRIEATGWALKGAEGKGIAAHRSEK